MALVPSNIGASLSNLSQGVTDIFQNVSDTVQTVSSVYDQITGKSESAPVATNTLQGTVAATPASLETIPQKVEQVPSGTMIAIGAVVLIGVLLVIK